MRSEQRKAIVLLLPRLYCCCAGNAHAPATRHSYLSNHPKALMCSKVRPNDQNGALPHLKFI